MLYSKYVCTYLPKSNSQQKNYLLIGPRLAFSNTLILLGIEFNQFIMIKSFCDSTKFLLFQWFGTLCWQFACRETFL